MSSLRFKVVEEASNRKPVAVEIPKERPQAYYASKVFNRAKMFEYLPLSTYNALINAIDNKEPLVAKHRRQRGRGYETVGHRQWRTPLYPLVPASHRDHRREA